MVWHKPHRPHCYVSEPPVPTIDLPTAKWSCSWSIRSYTRSVIKTFTEKRIKKQTSTQSAVTNIIKLCAYKNYKYWKTYRKHCQNSFSWDNSTMLCQLSMSWQAPLVSDVSLTLHPKLSAQETGKQCYNKYRCCLPSYSCNISKCFDAKFQYFWPVLTRHCCWVKYW